MRLAVLPAFGSKWLLPRLKDFYIAHPGVTIHLYFLPHIEALDFNASEVQAAIYVGVSGWHDLTIDLLKAEELVVIASPLLNYTQHVHSEQRVAEELLLGVSGNSKIWCEWFSYHSLPYFSMRIGPTFETISHLIRAVIEGVGIGLVPRILVEEELLRGDLVCWGKPLTTYN
ncbi:LysR family transcriptional regulator, partial [Pseudomonas sp. HMWF031]